MPSFKIVALILALSLSAVSQAGADQSQAAQSTADSAAGPSGGQAKLAGELQAMKQALPVKKQELARLYRKWLAAKGRTPTEEEKTKFEEKRAKGEATFEDNPFISKNPLSNPAPARAAYYKKLEEVKIDEARIRQMEQELAR